MSCPLCNGTGKISVLSTDANMDATEELRPCPMGCKPATGEGVSGNMSLEGNEIPFTDYGKKRKRHIRAGHAKRAIKWYMGSPE